MRDTLLVGAALEVGADVRRDPEELVELLASQDGSDASKDGVHADVMASTPVMDLARKSIGKVDELLEATKK